MVPVIQLILHFGFPKTASSSLQFGPFLELERQNKVNLLTWRKTSNDEILEDRPSSRLFNFDSPLEQYTSLKKDVINILSDESLTAPTRLRKQNFGEEIDTPFHFPAKLKELFSKLYPDEIDILAFVVIREQSSLILSQYVEEINWKRYKGIDLLFDQNGLIDLSGYDIYDFGRYLDILHTIFNGRVKFLMYEDFIENPILFCDELDQLFGLENQYFYNSLQVNRHNAKNKSKYGTFAKDGKYFVPFLPENVSKYIKDSFRESNKNLVNYFPKNKLIKYGYIDA